jgi:hypothetical protein
MKPISLGGSGPATAKVMKTTTMTAAAALITRPVRARPSTTASRALPVRSYASFVVARRKTV